MSKPVINNLIITGGGTGGHIIPALALIDYLNKFDAAQKVVYVGRKNSLEQKLISNEKVKFLNIMAAPMFKDCRLLLSALKNLSGLIKSFFLILKYKPSVMIGFGGYTSFPILLAGLILRRKVVVHESNAIPGKSVRTLVKLGANLAYGLEANTALFQNLIEAAKVKVCFTGTPTRFYKSCKNLVPIPELDQFDQNTVTLMVMGGSQGASFLNNLMLSCCQDIKNKVGDFQIIHLTGSHDYENVVAKYKELGLKSYCVKFSDNMNQLYKIADCVLGRAGALSLTEFCCAELPAILIPLPSAAEDHQRLNAEWLASHSGAKVFLQNDFVQADFVNGLAKVLLDQNLRVEMGRANKACVSLNASALLWEFIKEC